MAKKTIQLILNTKTEHLGTAGEIINVKSGYARNYLLPKKIAETVTLGRLNYIKKNQQERKQLEQEKIKNYNQIKQQLETIKKFSIKKKISENNNIFGSVNEKEIIQIIANQIGFTLEKNQINLPEIKSLGVYKINIVLLNNIQTTIQLQILPEIL